MDLASTLSCSPECPCFRNENISWPFNYGEYLNEYGRTETGDRNYINLDFKYGQKNEYGHRDCLINLFDKLIDQDGYYNPIANGNYRPADILFSWNYEP